LKEASSEDLSTAVAEAYQSGYQKATKATAEKMMELTNELGEMMKGMGGPPAAA